MKKLRSVGNFVEHIRSLAQELASESRGYSDQRTRHSFEEAAQLLAGCALKLERTFKGEPKP